MIARNVDSDCLSGITKVEVLNALHGDSVFTLVDFLRVKLEGNIEVNFAGGTVRTFRVESSVILNDLVSDIKPILIFNGDFNILRFFIVVVNTDEGGVRRDL